MCTVVVLVRPGHDWPLLLAANRDERTGRPWDGVGSHWPERPGVVGGYDRLGGGTWMAARDEVIAAVLNRTGSLGPEDGKRSRGELPLLALEPGDASAGAAFVSGLDAGRYRTFNLVVADAVGAWFVRGDGAGRGSARALEPGLHIITAVDPNDRASPRVARHLPRFEAAAVPDPETGDWRGWIACLSDGAGPRAAAINVPAHDDFGTVCASLAAISAAGQMIWLFAAGPPDVAAFVPVTLQ